MASFFHHERSSLAKELTFVLKTRPLEMRNTYLLEKILREEKFRDDVGLYETCVIVREMSRDTQTFCTDWWDLLNKIGLRDQVILPLVIQRHRKKVDFKGLCYKWRSKKERDLHLDWPRAPWVERNPHR
jgi:hypothetical protein